MLVVAFAAATLLSVPLSVRTQAEDSRFFSETSHYISNPRFLDYFDSRGGVSTFGYPISREFQLLGYRVQFFQRFVMQLASDGSVRLLNLLDSDIMPYTTINGATLPSIDPELVASAPAVGSPDYGTRIVEFVRDNAPDEHQGSLVRFGETFLKPVRLEVAFPEGGGHPDLLPLMDLEIWGVPISPPAYDPNNMDFVYLRFQRNVMHFDQATGTTQGLLLGHFFKALITGEGLPLDLDQQAASSPFRRQYNNAQPLGLNRPSELPDTNMKGAFEPEYALGVPTPIPTATSIPTATPTAGPPTPTPIVAGPDCAFDGDMVFVPEFPRAGDVLTVTVTSPTSYNSVQLIGPGSPHYIGAGTGLRGYVWKWRTLVSESGLYNYDFFVNGTQLCVAGFFNSGAATPTPGPTSTSTPTPTATQAPAPVFVSYSPNPVLRGGLLTISGYNFGSSQSAVSGSLFVGGQAATVQAWQDNQILSIVSTSAMTGTVPGVVVARGQAASFTVNVQ